MSLHHTTRTAIDIRDRLENLSDHLQRPELQRDDVLRELTEINRLVKHWTWFQTDRRFANKVAELLRVAEHAEGDDDIAAAAINFAGTIRAVVDPF